VPITGKVLVDKDAILDLIDQLRVAIPEEVSAAKRINAEGERIVEQAEDVATGIRAGADDYAAQILNALEQEIAKALSGIRKGMEVLDDRKADLREAPVSEEDRDGSGNGQLLVSHDEAEEHEGSRSALTR